jgi:diguanylate cyclase (GGDEF)-like protein/PAS domain S-box-containing protein
MPTPRNRESTSSSLSVARDLLAVAATTASPPLFDTVLRVAMLRTNAHCAVFLRMDPQGLQVVAQARADDDRQIEVRLCTGAGESTAGLPTTILAHASSARCTVRIDDTGKRHRFSADAAVLQRNARSILCLPLMRENALLGALYLENTSAHAFTPTRIAVLELLAAQAAITLSGHEHQHRRRGEPDRPEQQRTSELQQSNAELLAEIASLRQLEANLATDRNLLRTLIDNIPDQIFVKDARSRIIIGNKAQAAWIGVASPEDLTGKSDLDLYPPEIGQMFYDDEQQLMHTGQVVIDHIEFNVNQAGIKRWCYVTKVPLRDEQENVIGLVGIARDITERIEAEMALRLRNRAIELSINAIVMTDNSRPNHPIEFVNPAFERITGYSAEEACKHGVDLLLGSDAEQSGAETIRAALREQRPGRAVIRNSHKTGTPFWTDLYVSPVRDTLGEVTHFVWMIDDITESRNYEEQLKQLASYDALTGLPNRRMLMDLLAQCIAMAKRSGQRVALAFFDLDRFKIINDSLGHGAGDELLLKVAERVRACVRRSDSVARLGGDEFVVLLPETSIEHAAQGTPQTSKALAVNPGIIDVLKRIRAAVSEPVTLADRELRVTCSVGVSFFPADGCDAETLLKNADAAMYRAKEKGGDAIELYTTEMNSQVSEQLAIETLLRNALDRNEFSLVYQPKVRLADGRISGVEALLRWHSPDRGTLLPPAFLPILERNGMINAVGKWVMREAISSLARWRARGLVPPRITLNVSQIQLDQKSFVEDLQQALGEGGEPLLDLEITESLMMRNVDANIRKLRAIRDLGVGIAIDNFGTGHSSLSHLGSLPVSALKIDRAFVDNIATNSCDLNIVSTIVSLAHSMKLGAIAEGVETEEQRDLLRELHCDEIQGQLLSRPLPLEEFIDWQEQFEIRRAAAKDAPAT